MTQTRPLVQLGDRPRILVIRRDNIGDLVCTTPSFRLLRQKFPDAFIAALVNSYNAPVLYGNTDVDEIFAYVKGKHAGQGESRLAAWWGKLRLILRIRKLRFDLAIVASTNPTKNWLRLARSTGARRVLATVRVGATKPREVDIAIPYDSQFDQRHMTEQIALLLEPLGIYNAPANLIVHPRSIPSRETREISPLKAVQRPGLRLGIHISARKVPQRWPTERFPELIRHLHEILGCRFSLFWAPGSAGDPRHPGDDDKASEIMKQCDGLAVSAVPTHTVEELISGLAEIDAVICSDGGAMHLAAALDKPIVCFFGNSDVTIWRPWGVPYRVLQPSSHNVADVSVETVIESVLDLLQTAGLLMNATTNSNLSN